MHYFISPFKYQKSADWVCSCSQTLVRKEQK